MSKDKKNNIELNIAIGLAVLVLISVVFIFTKNAGHKETPSSEKEVQSSAQKKESMLLKSRLPEFEPEEYKQEPIREKPKDIEEDFEPKEETQEIMSLKDIPLDFISPGQETPEKQRSGEAEEAGKSLGPSRNIQPSVEDVRTLQQKGLIIY